MKDRDIIVSKAGINSLSKRKSAPPLDRARGKIWIRRFGVNIWRLKVPNKITVFAWHLNHDILRTRVNLEKTRILENSQCLICLDQKEDQQHATFEYPEVGCVAEFSTTFHQSIFHQKSFRHSLIMLAKMS